MQRRVCRSSVDVWPGERIDKMPALLTHVGYTDAIIYKLVLFLTFFSNVEANLRKEIDTIVYLVKLRFVHFFKHRS